MAIFKNTTSINKRMFRIVGNNVIVLYYKQVTQTQGVKMIDKDKEITRLKAKIEELRDEIFEIKSKLLDQEEDNDTMEEYYKNLNYLQSI